MSRFELDPELPKCTLTGRSDVKRPFPTAQRDVLELQEAPQQYRSDGARQVWAPLAPVLAAQGEAASLSPKVINVDCQRAEPALAALRQLEGVAP